MAEEDSRRKAESKVEVDQEGESPATKPTVDASTKAAPTTGDNIQMEVDEPVTDERSKAPHPTTKPATNANVEPEHKEDQPAPPAADEDDAVEY